MKARAIERDHRWATRLCLVVAFALTTVAALAMNWLNERAEICRRTETAVARLQAKSNALNSFEWWEAMGRDIGEEGTKALAKARAGMEEQFGLLKEMVGELPELDKVPPAYDAYVNGIDHIFKLLQDGKTEEAQQFDIQVVDPAFDELNKSIEEADAAAEKLALSMLRRLHQATLALFLGTAGTVALLLRQFHQRRHLVKVTAAEQRILREANEQLDARVQERTRELGEANAALQQEVAERKHAEAEMAAAKQEADRANHAKSEFLSRMSHEFRTPLNAILGFGQLLERQKGDEQQRTRVKHVMSAGRHLLNLINEVLDISRIEAGNLQLSLEPTSIADVLTEGIDLIRPMAADKNLEIAVPTPFDPDVFVVADRQRLKQVLLNLLSNAVKYTPEGIITVSHNFAPENQVRITVSDTGAGIAPEKLARLFTPFDRLGAEQTTIEGTGLGLALSQRLVETMQGRISVSSALGQGTSFSVDLPRGHSPVGQSPKREIALGEDAIAAPQRTLLYIEDNLPNLTLVEQILQDQPQTRLLTSLQGQLGLDLARKHRPDLILLDLHLPDLPGHKVLEQLQRDPATREIPVLVLSADATARQMKLLMQEGAAGYLTKPLDIEGFFSAVDGVLARKQRGEAVAA